MFWPKRILKPGDVCSSNTQDYPPNKQCFGQNNVDLEAIKKATLNGKQAQVSGGKDGNEVEVRKNLLLYFQKRGGKRKKSKFHVNETVRIWKKRATFHRGYDENFSREFFKIVNVKTNLPVPRYQLADSKRDVIIGSFFEEELSGWVETNS